MRRSMNFIAGAFIGALVGSVAALLLAPASGQELKNRAREKIAGVRGEIEQAYVDRRQELEAQLAAMRAGAAD